MDFLIQMAKTRSQTRNETKAAPKLKTPVNSFKKPKINIKKKNLNEKPVFIMRDCFDCFVRLEQIDSTLLKKYKLQNKNDSNNQAQAREEKKETPPKSLKPSILAIVASSQSALYTSRAVRLWEQKKKEIFNAPLHVNALVCARMAGHRPWPAIIVEIKKNGTLLRFYGSHNVGIVKKSEIIPYEFCKDIIAQYLKIPTHNLCPKTQLYHSSFIKATREISCIVCDDD